MDKHGKRKIIVEDTRDDVSTGSSSSSSSVSSTSEGILDVETFSERITPPFSMAIASKRNTGKTLLVSVLINELVVSKKIDLVLVMSQTAHVNDDYWFISSRLRQPFSEQVIEKLMVKQSLVKKRHPARVAEHNPLLLVRRGDEHELVEAHSTLMLR